MNRYSKLILELKQLYAQKDDMLIADRAILKQTPNIDAMKTHQLQKFIRTIAPLVKQSTREAKKLGKRQRKITQFFRSTKRLRTTRMAPIFLHHPRQTFPPRPPPEPDPQLT